MEELHKNFFSEYKDVLVKWYKDNKDKEGRSERCKKQPPYKHPETEELLTYDPLMELTEEQQFKAFFPDLNEENWA